MALFFVILYILFVIVAGSLLAWDRYHFGPQEKTKEGDREPQSITKTPDP